MTRRDRTGERMARGMGLLSLGIGVPALAAPEVLAPIMGLRNDTTSRTMLTIVGLRETILGIGLLAWPRFAGWMWGRVAGDAMDLAILGSSLATSTRRQRSQLATITAVVVGVTVLDTLTAIRLSRRGSRAKHEPGEYELEAKRAITINRPREEIYQAWRDFRNLPRFMENLVSIELLGDNQSHWVAKAPAGATVEWDATMTEDQPNTEIAWHSLPGSSVENAGMVRFVPAPNGKGTEIHVQIRYNPPAGKLGAAVAKIFGKDPGQQMASDLRRFKQIMETGEIARSDASVRGGGAAQPPRRPVRTEASQFAAEPAQI